MFKVGLTYHRTDFCEPRSVPEMMGQMSQESQPLLSCLKPSGPSHRDRGDSLQLAPAWFLLESKN